MKKKIFIFTLIFLAFLGLTSSSNMPFAKKCTKCIEGAKKDKQAYPSIGIMQRDFGTPHKEINGKKCACFRCCYGHEVWVSLEDNTVEK